MPLDADPEECVAPTPLRIGELAALRLQLGHEELLPIFMQEHKVGPSRIGQGERAAANLGADILVHPIRQVIEAPAEAARFTDDLILELRLAPRFLTDPAVLLGRYACPVDRGPHRLPPHIR